MNRMPHTNNKEGFTIVETLVAIFILLISVTGPLAFAQNGLRASFVARDQVVAFYLAQDAIETIKNIRDTNSLQGDGWMDGLSECIKNNSGVANNRICNLNTTTFRQVEACHTDGCQPMRYESDEKLFMPESLSSGTASKYTRSILMYPVESIGPDTQEMQIIVEVEWDTNFFSSRRVVVQENIYNWVPNYSE